MNLNIFKNNPQNKDDDTYGLVVNLEKFDFALTLSRNEIYETLGKLMVVLKEEHNG